MGTRLNIIIPFQDAIASVLLAIFLLSGAASSAFYSSQWGRPPLLCDTSILHLSCGDEVLTGLMGGMAVSNTLCMHVESVFHSSRTIML